ncbi:MAG TPA: type II secretion system protein [Tepidisphaeraceae bacterium]|nr:type II secretion system protein [Tepidisphaeraceae bacterium]
MSRRAFSLIEMIVVIGILMVLLSILLPVVGSARDSANGMLCASHIRTLTQAFIAFAADHDGHLPGSKDNLYSSSDHTPETNQDHMDWLFGQYSFLAYENSAANTSSVPVGVPVSAELLQLATAPQFGTIWRYVNNNSYSTTNLPDGGSFQTYLCPSLTTTNPGGGIGSNGRFDYAAFSEFDGAAIKDIAATSVMHTCYDASGVNKQYTPSPDPRWSVMDTNHWYNFNHQWSTQYAVLPTPIICQEDAKYNINSNLEGQHAGPDQMAHVHHGGSFYGSVDGTVTWVNEPDLDLSQFWLEGAYLWETIPPSQSSPIVLRDDPGTWNWWAGQ